MARKKMSKAKKKAKKHVEKGGGKAFVAAFYDIRDEIDAVVGKIMAAKKYSGQRKENELERQHADRMLKALGNARRYAIQECCQNDQGCTLFMAKTSRR